MPHTSIAPHHADNLNPGDLVDEQTAAEILDVPRKTLANWRWKGLGPRVRKVGQRLVRYHRADLLAFIDRKGAA